jgi:hypothetical protein
VNQIRRMNWTVGLLSIGAVILGTSLDRRRQRERQRLARPEIHRWEDEGGAVPVSRSRTAAQTEADPMSDPVSAAASL